MGYFQNKNQKDTSCGFVATTIINHRIDFFINEDRLDYTSQDSMRLSLLLSAEWLKIIWEIRAGGTFLSLSKTEKAVRTKRSFGSMS
jgi:hypothetical protein